VYCTMDSVTASFSCFKNLIGLLGQGMWPTRYFSLRRTTQRRTRTNTLVSNWLKAEIQNHLGHKWRHFKFNTIIVSYTNIMTLPCHFTGHYNGTNHHNSLIKGANLQNPPFTQFWVCNLRYFIFWDDIFRRQ
jgi:hypothetical protein